MDTAIRLEGAAHVGTDTHTGVTVIVVFPAAMACQTQN
jgi:hypothetical protein